jgi:hypothetical protein
MALLAWLSQSNPDLEDVFSEEPSTNGGHSMMDMDIDAPVTQVEVEPVEQVEQVEPVEQVEFLESIEPAPARKIDVAVELRKIRSEEKKEYAVFEDLEDDPSGDEVSYVLLLRMCLISHEPRRRR